MFFFSLDRNFLPINTFSLGRESTKNMATADRCCANSSNSAEGECWNLASRLQSILYAAGEPAARPGHGKLPQSKSRSGEKRCFAKLENSSLVKESGRKKGSCTCDVPGCARITDNRSTSQRKKNRGINENSLNPSPRCPSTV